MHTIKGKKLTLFTLKEYVEEIEQLVKDSSKPEENNLISSKILEAIDNLNARITKLEHDIDLIRKDCKQTKKPLWKIF